MEEQKLIFRVNIIYAGKYADKSGSSFIYAKDKADAEDYINSRIKALFKEKPVKYKLATFKSSQDEIDFFDANIGNRFYRGMVS